MTTNKSVLVIDDERILLDLVEECLLEDFSVIHKSDNAEDAKDRLLEKMYDCILVDIDLSGTNGAEVIKFIEDYDPCDNGQTPIIVMSALVNDAFQKKFEGKFAGILPKPFRPADLQAKVLIALGKCKRVNTKKNDDLKLVEEEIVPEGPEKVSITVEVDDEEIELDAFNPEVTTPFKIAELDKKVGKFLNKVKKNPKLKDLFKKLKVKDGDPYMMTHIGMLINISTGIAEFMEWGSEQTLEKFIFASYLHDLALGNNHELAKLQTMEDIEKAEGFSADELKLAKFHPLASVRLFEHKSDIPVDVQTIVMQHHERPDGSGFPNGLTHQRITPLSSIFIVAHHLTNYILDNPKNWTIDKYIQKNKSKFKGAHFRKVFFSLEKLKK